nr:PREDICTED: uncharacterized protein LOC109038891 [Bemisia tabaci]XP_018909697.1 PREDICTED: uncharacterized protein LOC109038891 [Bemisia tabaci]
MIEWLQTEVFPAAVESGSFGAGAKFLGYEPSGQQDSDISDIFFGTVNVELPDGGQLSERVYVKVQTKETKFYHLSHNIDAHFHNEVLFYTELLPLLRKYDTENFLAGSIPEFVYGRATLGAAPDQDVIVQKDLSLKGFRMTKEKLFLDEKHIRLTVDRLAKFHALAIMCQHENPEAFNEVVSKIKATNLHGPSDGPKQKDPFDQIKFRGIDPLKEDPEYSERLTEISRHCEWGASWLKKYMGPSDAINTLTHGDLTRHNLMFRYDDQGEPVEVVLCDWACIRYCTPVSDLSLFLILDTSPELKRSHWDIFLSEYYSALSRVLDGHASKPSFEDLQLEMRKKGVYGYHWAVYMLPAGFETELNHKMENTPLTELFQLLSEAGGPKATEYLTDIVKFMLDHEFIFEVDE